MVERFAFFKDQLPGLCRTHIRSFVGVFFALSGDSTFVPHSFLPIHPMSPDSSQVNLQAYPKHTAMDIQAIQKVLSAYPKDHQANNVCPIAHLSGLGGADHWRVEAPIGPLVLRRWHENRPTVNRLQYIQAVLWHAVYEGFKIVPLPCETAKHQGFVSLYDSFWELMPCMEGERDKPLQGSRSNSVKNRTENAQSTNNADSSQNVNRPQLAKNTETARLDSFHSNEELWGTEEIPESDSKNDESKKSGIQKSGNENSEKPEKTISGFFERKMRVPRIVSAMMTLAQFHEVTSTFPLPNEPLGQSDVVKRYLKEWKNWVGGDISLLLGKIREREKETTSLLENNLIRVSHALIDHFLAMGVNGMMMFARGAKIPVPIQPCIGNAYGRHLLFDRESVSGMVDFKELGADTVARDIASLLGSMAGNDPQLWSYGLKAYRNIRNLSESEVYLTTVIDFAEMILSGLRYLDQVFLKQLSFREEQLQNMLDQVQWQVSRLDEYRFGHNHFVA